MTLHAPLRMVPAQVHHAGRLVRYAVSDNAEATLWAVNIHGYFAGGSMYWRESAWLASELGWRVVNVSMPGFGGSDPLPWEELSMRSLAASVLAACDAAGAGPLVAIGHSLGAAVAAQLAADNPSRVVGLLTRDGAGTPSWKIRHGPLVMLAKPLNPDLGALADLLAAAVADLPDLAVGRALATARSALPDLRRNARSVASTLPVAALLFTCDQRRILAQLSRAELPMMACWGRFDRLTPLTTARELEELTGAPVVMVAGGHSWMLARPRTQARVLVHHPTGRRFVAEVHRRALERRRVHRSA